MEETEMEVEEESLSNSSTFKRFGIKNSIQTNFGDDYVFQIVSSEENSTMAVSLSTNTIKLYSPVTGQYSGEFKGHSGTINQISFSGPSTPHILNSCSSDGTIRAWDTRTFKQVYSLSAGSSQEIFSFSFGGSSGNLLSSGCKSQILFWDWRNGNRVACLEESHVDDVTQVHFVPGHQNKLLSASVDGLICTFDTDGNISDDDNLESVDYFVDCHYSDIDDRLWVIGGTNAGTLGYFPVNYNGVGAIASPEAVLEGGHTGVVRSVLPTSSMHGGPAHSQGVFGWTGGEDGRLCCWLSDESSEIYRSWISSALVMKSPKNRRKNRHNPY
ncbi:hypothetical protein HHK36_026505 [Tetracentron sinense]|uniref:Uncharacterized protein n=1 Tax=Tetracentron sinense TaxID=13715 RepID=A0A835D5J3_TETSI|nr:hypothetical protein HHK36_026505 [Tetracentron sinense]